MEKADYLKWLEKARESTDVKGITQTYMKKGNCFKGADFQKEE